MSYPPYRFAPAAPNETFVFGAAKPDRNPQPWLDFMRRQAIARVCCLLEESALRKYSGLIAQYQQYFGEGNVLWAPIPDFTIAPPQLLTQTILPFLTNSIAHQQKVVVHCAGGLGRTGQVLAAWLVYQQGLSNQEAIETVKAAGRKPQEAIRYALLFGQNPANLRQQLNLLLDSCRNL